MLTTSLVDATAEGFPTPSLHKNSGNTNYASTKEFHQLLTANTASDESGLGGGKNRYLGLVLLTKQHDQISNTPFFQPSYLGITETFPE